jgi:predicted transposase YbfD/YdcC
LVRWGWQQGKRDHRRWEVFDLHGWLVTVDALHCQGETARLIEERGGKWLFALKANRPAQLAEVETWFADPNNKPDTTCQRPTPTRAGSRSAPRGLPRHKLDIVGSALPDEAQMTGLAMIGKVEAAFKQDGKTTTFHRFFMSSVRCTRSPSRPRCVRWRIENSLHWVDVDSTRSGHGTEKVARPRTARYPGTRAQRAA